MKRKISFPGKYNWVVLFGITMGIFEAAVVVYLRAIFYPEGFDFPLAAMDGKLLTTEVLREIASLIMILSVAFIAAKKFSSRFGIFILIFACWDISYYIFLKILLNWPLSLLTWDVLFLIPVTWTGPVISPILISCIMILWGSSIIFFNKKEQISTLEKTDWIGLITGAFIVFLAFIWDYLRFIAQNNQYPLFQKGFWDNLEQLSLQYEPHNFPWLLFLIGIAVLLAGWINYYRRIRKKQ